MLAQCADKQNHQNRFVAMQNGFVFLDVQYGFVFESVGMGFVSLAWLIGHLKE